MRGWMILALLAFAPGCRQVHRARVQAETKVANLLVSREQEQQIGDQIHQELRRQGVRMLDDPEVQAYCDRIVDRLAGVVKKQKLIEGVHVHVVDDDKTVNAMATPGAHVYVFTGLLLDADDEAEVAGVLAHELGHVAARHVARQMVYVYGYEALAALALGRNPGLLQQIAAQIVGKGALAANSRADEAEADDLGLTYLHWAGYDPRGLPRFFRKIKDQEPQTPAVLSWLSSHPTTQSRIEDLRKKIHKRGWETGEVGEDAQAAIVHRLRSRGAGTK